MMVDPTCVDATHSQRNIALYALVPNRHVVADDMGYMVDELLVWDENEASPLTNIQRALATIDGDEAVTIGIIQ